MNKHEPGMLVGRSDDGLAFNDASQICNYLATKGRRVKHDFFRPEKRCSDNLIYSCVYHLKDESVVVVDSETFVIKNAVNARGKRVHKRGSRVTVVMSGYKDRISEIEKDIRDLTSIFPEA